MSLVSSAFHPLETIDPRYGYAALFRVIDRPAFGGLRIIECPFSEEMRHSGSSLNSLSFSELLKLRSSDVRALEHFINERYENICQANGCYGQRMQKNIHFNGKARPNI